MVAHLAQVQQVLARGGAPQVGDAVGEGGQRESVGAQKHLAVALPQLLCPDFTQHDRVNRLEMRGVGRQ